MCHSTPESYFHSFVLERLLASGDRVGDCLIWRFSLNEWGYGYTSILGKRFYVHRLIWTLLHGAIPEHLRVCHNCPGGDNPACFEPSHLWLGTPQQNSDDMVRKGRSRGGRPDVPRRLTDEQVIELRSQYAGGGISYERMGAIFGISNVTAYRIVKRQIYRDVA